MELISDTEVKTVMDESNDKKVNPVSLLFSNTPKPADANRVLNQCEIDKLVAQLMQDG